MKTISRGKVRDLYVILNQMSIFWFNKVSDILPNHILSTKTEDFPKMFQNKSFQGRSLLVKKLNMLPIECIVRGYLSGSSLKSYRQKGEIGGVKMPRGLRESEKLPFPIFPPSTKAHSGSHDENISFEDAIESYEVGRSQDSLDKEYLRNWLRANGYEENPPSALPREVIEKTKEKYLQCYEKIVGHGPQEAL